MRERRVKWVIALAVVLSGIWFMGVMYVMTYKPEVYNAPGVVVVPSPVASPMSTIRSYTPTRSRAIYKPVLYGYNALRKNIPNVPMQSMRIRTTSSAQVHSVGGGGNGSVGMGGSHGGSSRGIIYSTASVAMPQTNFIAMASSRQMAEPAATQAPSMARVASAPRHAPGPPNIDDLPDEHQLTEQPIGDGLWFLLLLAIGYIVKQMTRRSAGHLF